MDSTFICTEEYAINAVAVFAIDSLPVFVAECSFAVKEVFQIGRQPEVSHILSFRGSHACKTAVSVKAGNQYLCAS